MQKLRGELTEEEVDRLWCEVQEGDVIELGQRTLRVWDTPGHSPCSISLFDDREGVLITGDLVKPGQPGPARPQKNPVVTLLSWPAGKKTCRDIAEWASPKENPVVTLVAGSVCKM